MPGNPKILAGIGIFADIRFLAGIFLRLGTMPGLFALCRSYPALILLNDFTCRETRLHNADWFIRMITLGSIQRYAV